MKAILPLTPTATYYAHSIVAPCLNPPFSFLEFFAGSGLVSYAIAPFFSAVWANDNNPKKVTVYSANSCDEHLDHRSITEVSGASLPDAMLSWASFPCQDLSLAGNGKGILANRSGLVWEWLRVMDEMPQRPPVLVAENVVGLVSANNGEHYKALHNALVNRGYLVGAVLLDAVHWLPHSRPRIFVIAVDENVKIPHSLISEGATWVHSPAIRKIADDMKNWVWWNIPLPQPRSQNLSGIVDFNLPLHDDATSSKNLGMVPEAHMRKLHESGLNVVPGYKRIRKGKQVLELRFDEVAGCLRTPSGGSSRQYLVLKTENHWKTRILSPREAARLMGAPEEFQLPGTFNDGYRAMGDAVAAPVAEYLAKHLLFPLAKSCAYDNA